MLEKKEVLSTIINHWNVHGQTLNRSITFYTSAKLMSTFIIIYILNLYQLSRLAHTC